MIDSYSVRERDDLHILVGVALGHPCNITLGETGWRYASQGLTVSQPGSVSACSLVSKWLQNYQNERITK